MSAKLVQLGESGDKLAASTSKPDTPSSKPDSDLSSQAARKRLERQLKENASRPLTTGVRVGLSLLEECLVTKTHLSLLPPKSCLMYIPLLDLKVIFYPSPATNSFCHWGPQGNRMR